MPDSIRSCGELIEPPARITSRAACATLLSPRLLVFDAGGAPVLDDDPGRVRVHLDLKVGAHQRRAEICHRGAAPPSVADGRLRAAESFLTRAVIVRRRRMACRNARLQKRIGERIGKVWHRGRKRPVAAAIGVGPALPILLPPEIGQHVRIGPVRQAHPGPAVIVAAMAAHIGHGVDRGRAADDLAAIDRNALPGERRLGLGRIVPVVAALDRVAAPQDRDRDQRIAVPSARLEQEDARVLVLGEPIRKRAPGRARADDHVVVGPVLRHPAPPKFRPLSCHCERSDAIPRGGCFVAFGSSQ